MNAAEFSAGVAHASDIDLRGFVYDLDPFHQKAQWQLDRSTAEFAQARQTLAEIEARMVEVLDRHDREAQAAGQLLQSQLLPEFHRRTLVFLAELRGRWSALDDARKAQQATCERLRQACVKQQMRLESLVQHRAQAVSDYAAEMRQRQAIDHDRDWLARRDAAMRARTRADRSGSQDRAACEGGER
jgi:hypothetical protein